MAWRTLVISNPARLRIRNDQLVIEQEGAVNLPIEDIAVLMIESPEVLLSSAVLNRLAELDVTLLVCDRRHLPCMAGVPFAGHSRLAGVQRMQLAVGLPFRKRCWQAVVKRKIANQARCLEILGRPGADKVARLGALVASGDPANIESVASREHFREAFGPDFIRGEEDLVNSALNYGYAVMRAAVARAVCAHGFLPAHGIHHHSELNQFNLADDFVEPLRPVVDLCVAGLGISEAEGPESDGGLSKERRETLVGLLYADVLVEGARHAALHAAELMASSFLTACRQNDPSRLKLPEILPPARHSYE